MEHCIRCSKRNVTSFGKLCDFCYSALYPNLAKMYNVNQPPPPPAERYYPPLKRRFGWR